MKLLVVSLALAVAVAMPALADDDKDKLTAAERRERTELWLETQKRRYAQKQARQICSASERFEPALRIDGRRSPAEAEEIPHRGWPGLNG